MAGGAQIEARDNELEATPLHVAAYRNRPDIVKTLLDVYTASINATDKDGDDLHLAAGRGHV